MGKSGMQVSIWDLFDAEGVEHFVVVAGRQFFEFVDSDLPVIDRDKVHEFLVLLDIHVHLLDSGGVGVDIFVDGRLWLEEALQSSLAQCHFLEFSLLISLSWLGLRLQHLLVSSTLHCTHHGLNVEQLVSELQIGVFERISPLFNVLSNLQR